MSDSKFSDMSATALRDGYWRKRFPLAQVTDAMLAVIEAWNLVINAFLHADGEATLDLARAA